MAVASFSSSFKWYAIFVISLALVALFYCTFLFSKFFQYKIWLFFRAKSLLCFFYSKRKIFCFLFIKYWQVCTTTTIPLLKKTRQLMTLDGDSGENAGKTS